jgi:archaetidylinositol phosphate synthase
MVLDRQRRLFDFFLVPLGRALAHVNPNVLTLLGLLAAVPAAALFYLSRPASEASDYYLVMAALLVMAHGLLDMLDGVVARLHKKETELGDFFDHVVDRVADILLLGAVALSPWGDLRVGLAAVAATLLTSYLGTQAQAVGAGRMYSGFVARADRLVLLMAAPLADHLLVVAHVRIGLPGNPYVLTLVLWYIAVGGTITALERFVRIYRFLRRKRAATPAADARAK